MKLKYDELIPVILDKRKNETEYIAYNSSQKATITAVDGVKLKYQLKDSVTGNITSFIPVRENEVIGLITAGFIRFEYQTLQEDKQISLLLFK